MEARCNDFEKRYAEEKASREEGDARIKSLKRRIKELKEQQHHQQQQNSTSGEGVDSSTANTIAVVKPMISSKSVSSSDTNKALGICPHLDHARSQNQAIEKMDCASSANASVSGNGGVIQKQAPARMATSTATMPYNGILSASSSCVTNNVETNMNTNIRTNANSNGIMTRPETDSSNVSNNSNNTNARLTTMLT